MIKILILHTTSMYKEWIREWLFDNIISLRTTSSKLRYLNSTLRILSTVIATSSRSLRCFLSILRGCDLSSSEEVVVVLWWLCCCCHCLAEDTVDPWQEIGGCEVLESKVVWWLLLETEVVIFLSLFSMVLALFLLSGSTNRLQIVIIFLLYCQPIIIAT